MWLLFPRTFLFSHLGNHGRRIAGRIIACVNTGGQCHLDAVMLGGALWALSETPQKDLWLLRAPIGLYAGWLTAASAVSIGLIAAGWSWPPLGETGWAFVALGAGLAIAAAMLRRKASLFYGVALVWALVAVFVQNGPTALGVFAAASALGVAGLTLLRLRRARRG